jgi:hypothetical protein
MLGLPTAVVVTTEFLHEANMQRDALGMPGLVPVVIDHPLSTLTDTQIAARAEPAMVQCVAMWTGNGDAASPARNPHK